MEAFRNGEYDEERDGGALVCFTIFAVMAIICGLALLARGATSQTKIVPCDDNECVGYKFDTKKFENVTINYFHIFKHGQVITHFYVIPAATSMLDVVKLFQQCEKSPTNLIEKFQPEETWVKIVDSKSNVMGSIGFLLLIIGVGMAIFIFVICLEHYSNKSNEFNRMEDLIY